MTVRELVEAKCFRGRRMKSTKIYGDLTPDKDPKIVVAAEEELFVPAVDKCTADLGREPKLVPELSLARHERPTFPVVQWKKVT